MARSRNIKPGFFTNDRLCELEPLARLLFAGLWTLADREGRLEDRPKRIKAEVLPYDHCDAEELLQSLHDAGFIERYTGPDSRAFIQIVSWSKHQNPHCKEVDSTIPGPCKPGICTERAPDQHHASTVQEQVQHQPCTEQARLIPDSGFLIPDSLKETSSPKSAAKLLPCPVNEVIALYHEALPDLPRVRALMDGRKKAIETRWKWVLTDERPNGTRRAETLEQAIAWFQGYFEKVNDSDWLMGRSKPSEKHANWVADFTFLMGEKAVTHVLEKMEARA